MEGREGSKQQPHFLLAQNRFLLTHPDVEGIEKVRLKDEILSAVKSDGMVQLYETLAADSLLEKDQSLLDSIRAANEEQLKKLHDKIDYFSYLSALFFSVILA